MRVVRSRRGAAEVAALMVVAAVGLGGCGAGGAGDPIEAQRQQYTATLQGFQVVGSSPPAVASPAPTASPARKSPRRAPPAAAPTPSPEESTGLMAAPAATSDVELALLVHNGSAAVLPGLTLEVALLAGEEERQHYRIWIDTSRLAPGATAEIRSLLREVPYKTGERFAVEVRGEVPAAERPMYREFPRS